MRRFSCRAASVKALGKKIERLEEGLGLADVPEAGIELADHHQSTGGLGLAMAA